MTNIITDTEDAWNPADVDIGTEVAVRGILRGSELPGVLYMTRKATHWEQRGRWTTAHLNRDYVCKERLDKILETWIPHDFKSADAAILLDPNERKALWSAFEDGLVPWRRQML